MAKIFEVLRFAFKHRREILKVKNGIWELKLEVSKALSDKKIDRSEMLDILRQADTVLDNLIDLVENE